MDEGTCPQGSRSKLRQFSYGNYPTMRGRTDPGTSKTPPGEELDVLDEPVEFLLGGNDLLPRIEEALQGHSAGAKLSLHLEPEDAFGDFNDQLLFLEPATFSLPKWKKE